jgi:hypothetical protein
MNTAQVRSLSRDLLPHIPSYRHKGHMLFATPLNHVLRAFYFESSAFDRSTFYLWAFFLPLYVPTTHVSFNFGTRLRKESGCEGWDLSDAQLGEALLASIRSNGLPFLDNVRLPRDVPTAIQRLHAGAGPHGLEAIAYSLVIADKITQAEEALERLSKTLDATVPWQAEMMGRASRLARKLCMHPQDALQQLAEWEEETLKNLKLVR